tara:strand:+ start:6453 stop:6743 length:291 start_codon:yes stop_codon:yes gene_type:complete
MLKGIKITMIKFLSISLLMSQDLESLDEMWTTAKWETIEEVKTKEYKIEKITHVAGVRGSEAEDELLNYLYYRLNSKTNEIPPKLLQLLLSDKNTR